MRILRRKARPESTAAWLKHMLGGHDLQQSEDGVHRKQRGEAALLAPTAMNQQKFTFTCKENQVSAKAGLGFYSKTDLGIVKYHFELGAGRENFRWV